LLNHYFYLHFLKNFLLFLGKWTLFKIYWCKSSKNEIKRIFRLKEDIISHVLSVESISKSYFDLSLMKLFMLTKTEKEKIDYIYGNILLEKEKMEILRQCIYKNNKNIIRKLNLSMEKSEILDNLVDFDE